MTPVLITVLTVGLVGAVVGGIGVMLEEVSPLPPQAYNNCVLRIARVILCKRIIGTSCFFDESIVILINKNEHRAYSLNVNISYSYQTDRTFTLIF